MPTSLTSAGVQFPDSSVLDSNPLPSGTRLLFHQSTAPTGWTKDTTIDDHAIRVVSGSVSTGGTSGFTSAFGSPSVSGSVDLSGELGVGNLTSSISGNVDIGSTTLSNSQMPSHRHSYGRAGNTHQLGQRGQNTSGNSGGNTNFSGGSNAHNHNANHNLAGSLSGNPSLGTVTGSLTGGAASINVKYVDTVIAQRD